MTSERIEITQSTKIVKIAHPGSCATINYQSTIKPRKSPTARRDSEFFFESRSCEPENRISEPSSRHTVETSDNSTSTKAKITIYSVTQVESGYWVLTLAITVCPSLFELGMHVARN